jgi:hypothetical protein
MACLVLFYSPPEHHDGTFKDDEEPGYAGEDDEEEGEPNGVSVHLISLSTHVQYSTDLWLIAATWS